jgi:hypothetical protein
MLNTKGNPQVGVRFREAQFGGYLTGALDISLKTRRIISIPTQLGCRVGCTFCVSSTTPVIRNLTSLEMLQMVRQCLAAEPADGRPLELSFTGEGEAVLNWQEARDVCQALSALSQDFNSVRYCFSGIGADKLLQKLEGGGYPVRLQFSLHAARQTVRDRLVPRSLPLTSVLGALRASASRFAGIELNVVLQEGVNDSLEDLVALKEWGDPSWPIILNPLLRDGLEQVSSRADFFDASLTAVGRRVLRYSLIGASISRGRVYPLMSARKTGLPAPLPDNNRDNANALRKS